MKRKREVQICNCRIFAVLMFFFSKIQKLCHFSFKKLLFRNGFCDRTPRSDDETRSAPTLTSMSSPVLPIESISNRSYASDCPDPRKSTVVLQNTLVLHCPSLMRTCQAFWSSNQLAKSRAYISINNHMLAEHGHC